MKATFRTIAFDETKYWDIDGTPIEGARLFGIYLVREGEATYCCQVKPSSWCLFIHNEIWHPDCSDQESEASLYFEDFRYDSSGEAGHYRSLIDFSKAQMCSRPIEIEIGEDFDSDDEMHAALWEAATEQVNANYPYINLGVVDANSEACA